MVYSIGIVKRETEGKGKKKKTKAGYCAYQTGG